MNSQLNNLKFCDEATALIDIWRAMPRESHAVCPAKSDFMPMKMRRHLRSTILYERRAKDEIIIRVVGTTLDQFIGQHLTGKNILSIIPPEHGRSFNRYYENLHKYQCGGIMERQIRSAGGSINMVKTMQLPLLNPQGEATFFVGIAIPGTLPKHFTDYRSASVHASRNIDITYVDIGAGIPEDLETTLARGL